MTCGICSAGPDLSYAVLVDPVGHGTTSSRAVADRTGLQHIDEICKSITLTTARQFTRKDSPPALLYVHRSYTPPTPPRTARKGGFKGQSPPKNNIRCDARDSAGSLPPVTSMISLTTLLASATVAAAAKKVEDVPAPGVVDTVGAADAFCTMGRIWPSLCPRRMSYGPKVP